MPPRIMPGLGLRSFWDVGENDWGGARSEDLRKLSVVAAGRVLSRTTELPTTGSQGDVYIVPDSASTDAKKVAAWDNGAWVTFTPAAGWEFWVEDETAHYYYNGTADAWTSRAGGIAGLNIEDLLNVLAVDSPQDGMFLRFFLVDEQWRAALASLESLRNADAPGAAGRIAYSYDPGNGEANRLGWATPEDLGLDGGGGGGGSLTVSDLGAVTGTINLDADAADLFTFTAVGAVTLTFSTAVAGNVIVVRITNGGTNITWPSSVRWPEGTAPTLQAAGVDCIAFTTFDGGATLYASFTTLGAA